MSGQHPTPETKPLSEQEREELSAYLDQELDESATEAVTEALSRRPEVRREAESLRKTWDFLEYLPRPTAPSSFTERTMTRLESTKGILLRQGVRWRRFAIAGWAACVVLAAAFGFWITYTWGTPATEVVEAPVTDVIPAVESAKLPRKERNEAKIWQRLQREAILQRNQKIQRQIQLLLLELRNHVTEEELKQLRAAGQSGDVTYMQLIFDLAKKYKVDVNQIIERAARDLAEKQAAAAVTTRTKK
jgi:negative regulator of sigma E activity